MKTSFNLFLKFLIRNSLVSSLLLLFISSAVIYAEDEIQATNPEFLEFKQIQQNAHSIYDKIPASERKGSGYKPYKRWEYFWSRRINPYEQMPTTASILTQMEPFKQKKSNNSLQANLWTPLGPFTRPTSGGVVSDRELGRVNVVRVHPSNSNEVWAGSAAGGAWKSTDAGKTWKVIYETQVLSLGVSDIEFAASNPSIMYISTGDVDAVNGIYRSHPYTIGIMKSTDGGQTWVIKNPASITETKNTCKIIVNPTDPNKLLLASSDGILKSIDGGDSWVNKQKPAGGFFIDMEQCPSDPNIVYASTKSGGGASYIYRTSDGGEKWTNVKTVNGSPRIALAVSTREPDLVYAITCNGNGQFNNFLFSYDKGVTFAEQSNNKTSKNILGRYVDEPPSTGQGQGWYDLAIAANPNEDGVVFVGGINLWKTTDYGATWNIVTCWSSYQNPGKPIIHADIHDLIYDKTILYVGHDGGIDKTNDQGKTFTNCSDGLSITQFYSLSVSETNPSIILAGAQDNGTNRMTGTVWEKATGGDGMDCAIDPKNSKRMFASGPGGFFQRSLDGGTGWFSNLDSSRTKTEGDWVTPIAINPVNPEIVYAGYIQVWKSTDFGGSWNQTGTVSGGNYVTSITCAPNDENTIYISKGGNVYVSADAGATWKTITISGSSLVTSIAVDPQNSKRFWCTNAWYSASNKVYYYDGTTLKNITGNLPNVPVNSIVYQPNTADRIYIGTDYGVFSADNNSGAWSVWGDNLPNVIVLDMQISYSIKKLRIATFGRGIWEVNINACALPEPSVQIAGNTTFCQGDSVTLTAADAYPSYVWSNGATTKSIVVKTGGNYTVTVTDNAGCSASSKAIKVTVNATPDLALTFTGNWPICGTDSVNFTVEIPVEAKNLKWGSGDTSHKVTFTKKGTYSYTYETVNGCKVSAPPIVAQNNPLPAKPTIVQHVTYMESTPAFSYQWYLDGKKKLAQTQQTYYITQYGKVNVVTGDTIGCKISSDTFTIVSNVKDMDNPDLVINISPNPGTDIFNVLIFDTKDYSFNLNVSNLLGEKIFEVNSNVSNGIYTNQFNLAQYPAGIYLFTFSDGINRRVVRVIKS
ncbi:MAG: T9SS type A sorting domain-containing protein [Candidatus Kapabacteria bacterium]|nr:T9SS type A sorting domain-containing protein [Candidatus Kapabacteria bacterium]